MTIIIAGRVQLQSEAKEIVEQLIRDGFTEGKVTSFYVNPPGQHATYPIGGDRYKSPGPDETNQKTSIVREVTEALIGVDHPSKEGDADDAISQPDTTLRRAGMLVAVELPDQACQAQVVATLTRLGASKIEKTQGEIIDGEWVDFNPLSAPQFIKH